MSFVTVEKARPHVSVITLNRPERRNALSFDLVDSLRRAIEEVGSDNDCWVAILTGAGPGFCAGFDFKDEGSPPGIEGLPDSRVAMRSIEFMSDLVPALRAMPQPVIGAINGSAYGGGMCLTLGADIRIAARSARFCDAAINNGLTGTELGVSFLLPRLIGASRANEIILSGRELDALEAERIGLVSRVVPDEQLMEIAFELGERMCGFSPHGLAMTKKVLWSNLETNSLTAAIDLENRNQMLVRQTTRNLEEAMAAWREDRVPHFTD